MGESQIMIEALIFGITLGTIGAIAHTLRQKYPKNDGLITLLVIAMLLLAPFAFMVLVVILGTILGTPTAHH
jgi:type IV secretory pathway TrbL component